MKSTFSLNHSTMLKATHRSLSIRWRWSFVWLTMVGWLTGCASMGTPQGGPKDETPPVLLGSKPQHNAVDYKKKKIEIHFDELVSVQNATEKVIVSPPQKKPPLVSGNMKKIVVELQDSLKPNETYTIDFTDAIVDYNEGNPFGHYAFAFSTGPTIDTFCVSGLVLNAADLNPMKGVIVGVHSDLSDTAFLKKSLLRISKTDQNGYFCVRNLKEGPYHVFALNDQNRDYRFDQKGEGIAFPDSAISLWSEICQVQDTVWRDSLHIDTILVRDVTCFKPDNLLLRFFQEDFGRCYLAKHERNERHLLQIRFGFKTDSLPDVEAIMLPDSIQLNQPWYILEDNPTHDTLSYWLPDSALIALDTLYLQVDYLKTDSNDRLVKVRDTLQFIAKKEKSPDRKAKRNDKGKDSKPSGLANLFRQNNDSTAKDSLLVPPKPVRHLGLEMKIPTVIDVYSELTLLWETPLAKTEGQPWHLYKKQDTLWTEWRDWEIDLDEFNPRKAYLYANWDYGTEYKIELDSGCVMGIYGFSNQSFSQIFKVRQAKEYSQLHVDLSGLSEGQSAFVELLNKNDQVVRREEVVQGVVDFWDVLPGDYYLRLIMDDNRNFAWDTGCYADKRLPEQVFYFHKLITLKANWEIKEDWSLFDRPLEKQKPAALKPVDKKNKR